jgi:hypothetical protein
MSGQKGQPPSHAASAPFVPRGVGVALILPHLNTHAMNLLLEEISTQVMPGAHAVATLDGAGWHQPGENESAREHQPLAAVALLAGTEPQENIWQFLRQNYLANRTYEALVDACCEAWNVSSQRQAGLPLCLKGVGKSSYRVGHRVLGTAVLQSWLPSVDASVLSLDSK